MGYVDPQSVHNPATGGIAPASWGDTLRDNDEFFIAPPYTRFSHSTTQTVANVTATAMSGDTEALDTNTMHSTVTNNSRATLTTAGVYMFAPTVNFAGNATGVRAIYIRVNGTTSYTLSFTTPNATGVHQSGVDTLRCAAADYVEAMAYQSSGGDLACGLTAFSVHWIAR